MAGARGKGERKMGACDGMGRGNKLRKEGGVKERDRPPFY